MMDLVKAKDAELDAEEKRLEGEVNKLGELRRDLRRRQLALQAEISACVHAKAVRLKILNATDDEKVALAQHLKAAGFDASGAVGTPGAS